MKRLVVGVAVLLGLSCVAGCSSKQSGYGPWTDSVLTITPDGIGAVHRDMALDEAQHAAGIPLEYRDGAMVPEGVPYAVGNVNLSVGSGMVRVSFHQAVPDSRPRVRTAAGFVQGGSLADLKHVYGAHLEQVTSLDPLVFAVRESKGVVYFLQRRNVHVNSEELEMPSMIADICAGPPRLTPEGCWPYEHFSG